MSGSKQWWEIWGSDIAVQVCGTTKVKLGDDGKGGAIYNTVPNIDGKHLSFDMRLTVSCSDCGWSTSGMDADASLLREAVLHERNCPVARERRFSDAIEKLTNALMKEKAT